MTEIPGRTVNRKVHAVTPTMVVFEKEGASGQAGSRLYWPKAAALRFTDAVTAAVSNEADGKPFVTYRFG